MPPCQVEWTVRSVISVAGGTTTPGIGSGNGASGVGGGGCAMTGIPTFPGSHLKSMSAGRRRTDEREPGCRRGLEPGVGAGMDGNGGVHAHLPNVTEGAEKEAEELQCSDGEFDESHHLPAGGMVGPGMVNGEVSRAWAKPSKTFWIIVVIPTALSSRWTAVVAIPTPPLVRLSRCPANPRNVSLSFPKSIDLLLS